MSSDDRTLAAPRFEPLPTSAIEPRGWLRDQLELQAGGLTGSLGDDWPDLADNRWRGGTKDGWERGPYYADGLVPLSYLLDDDELQNEATAWVQAFVETQREDGWIGPIEPEGEYDADDPWPRFVVLKVLRQYYEATREESVLGAMTSFCRCLQSVLDDQPLSSWGHYRWADLLVSVYWLYDQIGESWLLDLAKKVIDQGYDWTAHFIEFSYEKPQPIDERRLETHVVNNAMGLKAPAVRGRLEDGDTLANAAQDGIDVLDRFHGQITGVFTGDEHLGGRDPTRGTELCAVVEYLYSLRHLISIEGDPVYGDRLERVAFNALPATFDPEMTVHQYDQQVNQVVCNVADRPWTNGPDANVFGIAPNFGCCTANLHQGWPKFANSLVMRTDDGGFAAVAYAPCVVETTLQGSPVRIEIETRYPFEDEIRVHVRGASELVVPLYLRIPRWTDEPTVTDTDGATRTVEPGTYHVVEFDGDDQTVELTVPAPIECQRRYRGSVALRRGPLVFSLPIDAQWQALDPDHSCPDYEVFPTGPWRVGLPMETVNEVDRIDIRRSRVGTPPFSPDDPPLALILPAYVVPAWDANGNAGAELPQSPVPHDGDRTDIELVPYGCTTLRLTEFPVVHDRTDI